jgi:hypothetical protein
MLQFEHLHLLHPNEYLLLYLNLLELVVQLVPSYSSVAPIVPGGALPPKT